MANYVETIVGPGEQVLYVGKVSLFSILPSLEVKLGYAFNPRTRVIVGYDLWAWDQVVRPGDQINRNVNLSQNAVLDPNGVGQLVQAAR